MVVGDEHPAASAAGEFGGARLPDQLFGQPLPGGGQHLRARRPLLPHRLADESEASGLPEELQDMVGALEAGPDLKPPMPDVPAEELLRMDLHLRMQPIERVQPVPQRDQLLPGDFPSVMAHHNRAEDEVAGGGSGAPEVAALVDEGDVHPAGDNPVAGASTPPIT